VQLLDRDGKESIPGTYRNVETFSKNPAYFAVKTDNTTNSWHLVSKEGTILTPGFEQIFHDRDLIHHLDIPYEYRMDNQPVFCAIANNQMYFISNHVPYLSDTTHFQFKQETFYTNRFIVNKKGEIIYCCNFLVQVNDLGYLDIRSGCTTLLSIDGRKKLEVDLIFSEIDWKNSLICFKTSENNLVGFDLEKWEWLTGN
jgi:hypothetical protein